MMSEENVRLVERAIATIVGGCTKESTAQGFLAHAVAAASLILPVAQNPLR